MLGLVWSFSSCMGDHSCSEFMRVNNHVPKAVFPASFPSVCSYILSGSSSSTFPELCCRLVEAVNIDVSFKVEHTLLFQAHWPIIHLCWQLSYFFNVKNSLLSRNNPVGIHKVSVYVQKPWLFCEAKIRSGMHENLHYYFGRAVHNSMYAFGKILILYLCGAAT